MKMPLPILDFVIYEDKCNLHCRYCYSSEILKPTQYPQLLSEELLSNVINIIRKISNEYDIGILKFSGGEILLYKNLNLLLKKVCRYAAIVQLQTNGLLLNSKLIQELSQIENLSMQVTLDGHLPYMNSYRMGEQAHQILLKNIYKLVQIIPTDITVCIHDRNIEKLIEFAEFIYNMPGEVSMNFIPIRHIDPQFWPKLNESNMLDYLNEKSFLRRILPPKLFIENMTKFINSHNKNIFICRIPIISLGVNEQGIVKCCPLLETSARTKLGNILEKKSLALSEVGLGKIHKSLMHPRIHTESCKKCFSYLEVLNYYVQGLVGEKELNYCWVYRNKKFKDILYRVKIAYEEKI